MAGKSHRAGYRITVSIPIRVESRTGGDPAGLPTEAEVRKLDGYTFDREEDVFDQYLESCGLYKRGTGGGLVEDGAITGGRLRLEYRPARRQLWAGLDLDAPRKLTPRRARGLAGRAAGPQRLGQLAAAASPAGPGFRRPPAQAKAGPD